MLERGLRKAEVKDLDEKSRHIVFLWVIFMVVSIALVGFDLFQDGLNWAYWPVLGMLIGFGIATAAMTLFNVLCPACGKMVSKDTVHCPRCGRKIFSGAKRVRKARK